MLEARAGVGKKFEPFKNRRPPFGVFFLKPAKKKKFFSPREKKSRLKGLNRNFLGVFKKYQKQKR